MQHTTDKHVLIQNLDTTTQIKADRERIGQVIMNFLSNAIKYSPEADKIIIKTHLAKDSIDLNVQDFGIGLKEEDCGRIFERFYRVGGDTQNTYPGLGLGLYICAEIIKRHNGKIWVESTEGKGSQFHFSLPLSI